MRKLRLVFSMMFSSLALSGFCANAAPVKMEKGISPGPGGALIGVDFRVPLFWLLEPGDGAIPPGDYGRHLMFQDRKRFYELHVPPDYKPGKPLPVVIVLHGGGGNPANVRWQSGMSDVADRGNFIAIYPAGTSPSYEEKFLYWNSGPKAKSEKQRTVNDVAFIAAVLDDAAKFFTIDPKRVYATGISNGAQMSFRLGCDLYNRIAAIAPVEGHRYPGEFFAGPPGPLPFIMFHSKVDPYIPYTGGQSPDTSAFEPFEYKPIPEIIARWVKHNGCDPTNPKISKIPNADCKIYTGQSPAGEIQLWSLDDGGHTWTGGHASEAEITGKLLFIKTKPTGPVSQALSASAFAWEFFKHHSLDERK